MRSGAILLVFFLLFTLASLLISAPMFPGNLFCALIGEAVSQYAVYLSALFNGIFYGTLLWLVFSIISRKFEVEK
jgi:hypothetical protein